MQNHQFIFEPKIQYVLTASLRSAVISNLQFPIWCPQKESNLHQELRSLLHYPLCYGGEHSYPSANYAYCEGLGNLYVPR